MGTSTVNNTGDDTLRNYEWIFLGRPIKDYRFDNKHFDMDTITILRYLQADPQRLSSFIVELKNTAMTKNQMYALVKDRHVSAGLVKPKKARMKSVNKALRTQ